MSSKGTSFPTVPLDKVPAAHPSEKADAYRPVVLVVDDESQIADSLTDILKRNGYAAISAYDGEAALETALVMPPELLISDVVLPGMNGIELATTLLRIFPDCKVILLSGQSSTARLLAKAEYDGHRFLLLTKPVHPRELLDRVAQELKPHSQLAAIGAVARN